MGDRALNFIEVRAWCGALEISWVEFTQQVDEALSQLPNEEGSGQASDSEADESRSA